MALNLPLCMHLTQTERPSGLAWRMICKAAANLKDRGPAEGVMKRFEATPNARISLPRNVPNAGLQSV